jgi:hypothetical protein
MRASAMSLRDTMHIYLSTTARYFRRDLMRRDTRQAGAPVGESSC